MPAAASSSTSGEALLGGVASAGACVFSNPIDVIRVRQQLPSRTAFPYAGIQAGLRPALLYNLSLNGARFSLFRVLTDDMGPIAAGLASGGVAGFMASPLAHLRTLLQAGYSSAESMRLLSRQPFAGAPLWALRNAGHTAAIFSLYQYCHDHLVLPAAADGASSPSWLRPLASSLFAASISCFLMNPLDVLATRVFAASAQLLPPPAQQPLRAAAVAAAPPPPPAAAAASAPVRPLLLLRTAYRGLGANLLRTVPHTVLTFVFIEALRERTLAPLPSAAATPAAVDADAPRRRVSRRATVGMPCRGGMY